MSGEFNFIEHGLQKTLKRKAPKQKLLDYDYKVKKQVKNYIKGEKAQERTMINPSDYDKIVEDLVNAPSIEELSEQSEGIHQDIQGDYFTTYGNAVGFLKNQIPNRQRQTLAGLEVVPPSDGEKSRFLRMVNIVNNPFTLFDKIDNDHVLAEEIEAVKTAFPQFSQLIDKHIAEQIVEEKVKNKDFKLTRKKERTLQKLVPLKDKKLASRLQDNYAIEEEAQQGSDSEMTTPMTDLEKVEYS